MKTHQLRHRLTTMIRLILAASLLALCGCSPFREGKIVGGGDADISEYPYQLQLCQHGSFSCGASVISRQWVLTAAHCVQWVNVDSLTLRAGATLRNIGGRVYQVSTSIVHPLYDNLDYDIALLKVNTPFEFGQSVQPIDLPVEHQRILQGEYADVSGWGYLRAGTGRPSTVLQHVALPIVSKEACEHSYNDNIRKITDRMICAGMPAGGKDACQGDSGGPMAVNGTLAGIVSWGKGCALPHFPGVYTNVSEFRDWIRENSGV